MAAHRSFVSLIAITASLSAATPQSYAAQPQDGQRQNMQSHNGGRFCRNAPALPQLTPEVAQNQQQQGTRPTPRGRLGAALPPPPPPPPSRAPAEAEADSGSGDVVVSGTAMRREASPPATPAPASPSVGSMAGVDDRASRRPPIMPPGSPPRPRPRPQSGILTAGEHDDLLNPLLYARYVGQSNLAQQIPDLPTVDTDRVLTVRVTDNAGRPIGRANVIITCSDGSILQLDTQSDGTAVFFPAVDQLSPSVQIRARLGRVDIGAPVRVDVQNQSGGQQINFAMRSGAVSASRAQQLDLTFVVDTTGSMGDEIRYLQSELTGIIGSLQSRHPGASIRVAFVFYRDQGDAYVTQTIGFDGNISRAQSVLMAQSAGGGGDYPEAMDEALIRGVGLDWRPGAVRSMVLVADAPPHDNLFGRTWAAVEAARAQRIHIIPVAASGVADRAEYAMRAMAAFTQSRYLFLTDDSGVGNPHAPPAIDCYLVTRLDAALRRVVESQLSGRRQEPAQQEVIRQVGDYDNGRCILPRDFSSQSQ